MTEIEKVLAILEDRRVIYAAKQEHAAHDERPWKDRLNYDREDLFRQAREAMEHAIDEARAAVGLTTKYGTD